jgi:phenylacetate-CoA ligase
MKAFELLGLEPEEVYLRLPTPLQDLGCSFVGWRTERTRYSGSFDEILTEAESRTHWSVDAVRGYRDQRLAEFVAHAAATVPFYRERFRQAGVDPGGIRSLDDLRGVPVLTKAEAQEHSADLVSAAGLTRDAHTAHTSGTTGAALRFPVTLRGTQEQWATWWRYRRWHGIERRTWSGLFAGRSIVPSRQDRPPFWRVNRPGKQLLFSGYHLSPSNLEYYVDELRRRKPPWLHGYPSLLSLIAAHLVETRSGLGYQLRWVTIAAENLLPHQIALMERAFGVKPLQHYGLVEGVANISECELGSLHVDEDFAGLEFLPTDAPNTYRVVGTNFSNRALPLIRYDTQDLVTLNEGQTCSCGRPGRLVERIDGRLEDYVILRSGARVGRMDHIFKDMTRIKEAQIRQSRPGEMRMLVVRGDGYSDHDEQMLLNETLRRVGDDMQVEIEYVTSLERSRTGKLRFVVSEIPDASIEGPVRTEHEV